MIFNPIVQKNTIISATTSDEWIRPTDWIPIPDIATGEEVVYMLNAVYDNNSNFIAFLFQGNYTVDWGDGNIENVNSNIKAEHQYNYADCGNLSERGYRQALIKVTPQNGQHLTLIDLQQYHTIIGSGKSVDLLDIIISAPNTGTIYELAMPLMLGGSIQLFKMVERCWIKSIGIIWNYLYMFCNFQSLQSLPLFDTSYAVTMYHMFENCYLLRRIPLFDTSLVFETYYMFYNCYNLITIPLLNLNKVTNSYSMFENCYSLRTFPNITMISFSDRMFYNCYSLTTIPNFNLSTQATMASMFENCYALKNIGPLDLSELQLGYYMFKNCKALEKLELYNITKMTNNYQMFLSGYLTSILLYNTTKSFDISGNKMSAEALNALGNSVADLTALPSAAVTVTGNFGAATMDDTIWTNKNWSIIK